MTWHPYKSAPDQAFWSRSVSRNWDPSGVVEAVPPLIGRDDRIVSAGSCFAANLVPYLEAAGFTYVRTEPPHPLFGEVGTEALSYSKFSAGYGNIYTARQLRQLLERCLGRFDPVDDRWVAPNEIVDPFRPGLRYPARNMDEFEVLRRQHLEATLAAFEQADVLIFTLGLTEAWASRIDGAVYPACPGTVAGKYDSGRHQFLNFSAAETTEDLLAFIKLLREVNSKARVILTVSPVPLVATATSQHVLVASTYSKAALRVAAHETCTRSPRVTYFPAYEIVTGPQAPDTFFESSRRDVSREAIDAVMGAFFSACGQQGNPSSSPPGSSTPVKVSDSVQLGKALIEAECEEAFADR